MIRTLAVVGLLSVFIPTPASAREFTFALFAGSVRTGQALSVTDAIRFTGGIDARMQIRGRAGYFIHFALGPARLKRIAAARRGESSVIFAHFAVGPVIRLAEDPFEVSWRIGYGAAGDELSARDLVSHGLTVARPLTGRSFVRLDVHHVIPDFSHIGTAGLTAGIGWRL